MSVVQMMYLPWLFAVCLAILLVAAFLHWQRTRHWCLLTLATGSLLVMAGHIAVQITGKFLRPDVVLPSGTVEFDVSLITTLTWFIVAGTVFAVVGGIGAIQWAIRLRPRRQQPPTTPAG
jgi:hypothetical protein